MTFWDTATHEQKMEQIKAGRELGMTAKAIGINLGCSGASIQFFCTNNGINLSLQDRYANRVTALRKKDPREYDNTFNAGIVPVDKFLERGGM